MTEKINLRRMLTVMPFLPMRTSSSRSHVEQTRPDSNFVEVWHFGGEKLPLQIPWSDKLNAELVCSLLAQHCGVPRLTGNLFGLYDANEKVWLCPSDSIAPRPSDSGSAQKLMYRVRFHTLTANPSNGSSGFSLLEECVVSYMFRQYRDSFLNDDIELSTEEKLGLIVLDFMQHVKEDGINVANLNGRMRFSHFLPKSLNDGLTWWDKRKLRRKVRSALTNFGTDTLDAFSFKIMFLVSLSEETKDWGTETFTTTRGDVYEVGGCKGVRKIKCGNGGDIQAHDSFQFEDIINITIYPANDNESTLFQINRRSTPPMFLEMKTLQEAKSFASLIDGYYRLLVDYYHYLNEKIAPPSLVQLVKNRCHGPIPLSKAKQKIEEAGRHEGTYLIRQNPEDHNSYCLTVRIEHELKNFKINHYEDDHVGMDQQPKFKSLRSFVEYYRSRENSWCLEGQLKRAVPIEPKDRSLRLLDNSALNEELPAQPDVALRVPWIPEDSLSVQNEWRHLGDGDFTSVYVADLKKRVDQRMCRLRVAVKRPKQDASRIIQEKFSKSVDRMSSWVHSHIIKFEGIGAGYMMIMEYASQGPLDRYLRALTEHGGSGMTLTEQLMAATQLIRALEYLESRRIVHGNVSAHNTLVVRGTPDLHIKLGDPMFSIYYHSLNQNEGPKLKRVRWTAPELLATNSEPTLAGDIYSYAITLWEIMSHGAIPLARLSNAMVREHYSRGIRLEKPNNCPDDVFKIMEQCWCHEARNRPPCRGVLRDIYTNLYDSYGEQGHGYMMVLQDTEPELIPEEKEEDEHSMGEQNFANERLDANSVPPSLEVQGEGLSGTAMASAMTSFIDMGQIDIALNKGSDQDYEVDEITIYGVDRIHPTQLTWEGALGAGHFGMVYRAKLQHVHSPRPDEDVAVKVIRTNRRDSRPEQFQLEIRAMSFCDHKNIVRVLGYCEDSTNQLSLVMEYFPLGSLEKYLKEKKDRVGHTTLYLFGQQICQGMKYLHEEKRMVHRDLAARNVLVANAGEVKITDFGLARMFGDKDYYRARKADQKVPIRWYAPEWLRHNKYQKESDVWSFGVVLWEMFSYGQDPVCIDYDGRAIEPNNLLDFFEAGKRLNPPNSCPREIADMMQECWRMVPCDRPKFSDLIPKMGRLIQKEEC